MFGSLGFQTNLSGQRHIPNIVLALFRTNQASAGLLLFFYALLLQLPVFFGAVDLPTDYIGGGLLGHWAMEWIGDRPFWLVLLPVLLITGQGILANMLVTRHRMSRKITQFPGLFLILCWALVPVFRSLHPLQFANLFLLLGLLSLGRLYKRDEPAVPLFNSGAWLGLASLFSPAYVLLIPAFAIAIGTLRRPDTRSMLQFLTGMGLVYFLVFSLSYLIGDLNLGLTWQWKGLGIAGVPPVVTMMYPGLIVLGLLVLMAMATYGGTVRLLNIEGKKNVTILLWVLLFGLLSIPFSAAAGLVYLQVITVPLGTLLGLWFIQLSSGKAEFYHLLLVVAALGPLLLLLFS